MSTKKSTTPRKSTTSKREYIPLEQFTEMVTLIGLDGTSHVLRMARDGMKPQELAPVMTFYAGRMATMTARERAAHKRKVQRLAAQARELLNAKKGGAR